MKIGKGGKEMLGLIQVMFLWPSIQNISPNFDESIILVLPVSFLLLVDKTIASRNVSFELCEDYGNSPRTQETALHMLETASKGLTTQILRSKVILKTTLKHRRVKRIPLKTAMDFRFLQMPVNFLSNWTTISFWRRIIFHEVS